MRLREVKQSVRSLSFRQLVKLDAWLHSLIETAERAFDEAHRRQKDLPERDGALRQERLPMLSGRATRPLLVRVLDGGREDSVGVRRQEAPAWG